MDARAILQNMPLVEVKLPYRVDDEIDQLVEQDVFINREQAIQELLSKELPRLALVKNPMS